MELLTIPQLADILDVDVVQAHQLVRDGEFIIVRTEAGQRRVPADFVQDGGSVKSLRAVIQLLRDARFEDAEIVDWLYRKDDTLPGTPIQALRENRGNEIKRRAQAAGF